jgi:hypothetical protein
MNAAEQLVKEVLLLRPQEGDVFVFTLAPSTSQEELDAFAAQFQEFLCRRVKPKVCGWFVTNETGAYVIRDKVIRGFQARVALLEAELARRG